jgi:hypothetical protein
MKIQVEVLRKIDDGINTIHYKTDELETVVFTNGDVTNQIAEATQYLNDTKPTLPAGDKIRVLEYYNDEPDETRQPCVILLEA